MELQLAQLHHAEGIAAVKRETWRDEPTDVAYIVRVIDQPGRSTIIASDESGVVIGFADGFVTLSAGGVCRWEVDLVAVHPAARGLGVARRMIDESTKQGREFGAVLARALIHVDNRASQRAFARCDYRCDQTVNCLLVSSVGGVQHSLVPPTGTHILPVQTLGYQGVWLEGMLVTDSFVAAQNIRKFYHWDVAGAVLPVESPAALIAEEVGYSRVGQYQWWMKSLV